MSPADIDFLSDECIPLCESCCRRNDQEIEVGKCKITLCQVLGSTYFYFWQNLHQISNLSNKYQIEDTKYKISEYQISIIKFQI